MRVYEFVISQLMGENGTRLTTDMMRVDHIDAGTKTIYLDTEKGVLYNPFRPGDILMVQRFSVDGIIKQYELQVVTAKVGDTSKGEERLDSITYKNFVGDEGSVVFRDVLTRVDSATNSDRKGVIKQTSVEEGSPYLDVLYGMKTDPDNAVRLRLGRLAGIITYWWGQLQGYGLYSNNAYLLGDFRLRTGEDVRLSTPDRIASFRSNSGICFAKECIPSIKDCSISSENRPLKFENAVSPLVSEENVPYPVLFLFSQ